MIGNSIWLKLFNKINLELVHLKVEREGGEMTSKTIRKFVRSRYNVDVGQYSYGSCFEPLFNVGGKIKIGRYCSFASNIHYFGANHPINRLSTSPYFYSKEFGFCVSDILRNELEIGNDVWIGYGVIITAACHKIGNGAIIGGGSVVTKNVEPYTIVAGNPAKLIRMRFSDEEIQRIEQSQWWIDEPRIVIDTFNESSSVIDFTEKYAEKCMNTR